MTILLRLDSRLKDLELIRQQQRNDAHSNIKTEQTQQKKLYDKKVKPTGLLINSTNLSSVSHPWPRNFIDNLC